MSAVPWSRENLNILAPTLGDSAQPPPGGPTDEGQQPKSGCDFAAVFSLVILKRPSLILKWQLFLFLSQTDTLTFPQDQKAIFSVVAAILHLGNLQVTSIYSSLVAFFYCQFSFTLTSILAPKKIFVPNRLTAAPPFEWLVYDGKEQPEGQTARAKSPSHHDTAAWVAMLLAVTGSKSNCSMHGRAPC